ncbi:regulatory inactivation of DnaA Hda protein [Acinetobacter marinus]|uniref:Regulatory inactivation of DnaA Hda protein n=1 Tax=Acinetobacter marinus TaxID=281375 RepID=A0A1G6KTN0_9GAMM|nr:DnaA/Hda family protein [Acinetobacter marinus]SDC33845.1 regulatory inactivation of DnaA Hda protein [Acinetobacter marinus]
MRQLKLEIEPYLDAQISDFAGPSWAPVIDNLRQFHTGLIRQLFIYGSAGSGKSHLLSAICDSFSELGKRAIHVPLLSLLDAPVEALEALEYYDVVALDDVEAINGALNWQKALFHLINQSYDTQTQLVFSSRFAPIELRLQFPDLQSRLNQAVSIHVPEGDLYADRQALLLAVTQRRGWQLHPQIIEYLLQYGPKHTNHLLATLDRIEQLLQGEQLKLSNQRLKQIFALIDQYAD